MKRKLSAALLCAALVAAVGVVWGISASRQGFSLIASNREMNSNQILFPDRETTKADQNQTDSDDSYWKQDNAGDKANQNGGSSGVLFDRDVTLPDGAGTAISGGDTAGGATGGPGASNVVNIVEPGNGGADIIIPGGGGSGNNSGQGGGSSEGPIPGYGSSSKDKLNTDYVRPTYGGEKDFHYSENTGENISQGGNYTLNIRQAYSANQAAGEGLYMGQKNVNVDTIFQSLEAFVLDEDNYVNYYWTLDDLYQEGKDESKCYIKITGVSFGYFSDEIITDFPVDMPTDQNYIIIYVSYRFRLSDDWTEYTGVFSPGVEYSLWKSRILVLREALTQEGQLIGKEDLLNPYAQYLDTWSDGMNLLEFQREMIGPKGTRLTTLFPGWMVDGLPAPILYDPGPGRYVLEPGKRVGLSSDYQVESREYWMKPDMEVLPSGQSEFNAKWVALQTLTDYLGADKVNDYVTHLKVPQFVQAVDFPYYPGVTADYLDLPETVLYVNTDGIASIDEDFLLYDRGLQVTRGYTVAEGNPRYTAQDGILYNAEMTQMLGVPTERRELVVPGGITKVILPHQNHISTLILEFESEYDIPEINYTRLRSGTRIVVPDDMVADYLAAVGTTLQGRGIVVSARSQWEQNIDRGYILQDGFLFTTDMWLTEISRESAHWVTLPNETVGVEAGALTEKTELAVLLLPTDGHMPLFEEGCFAALEELTIACYSQEQYAAAQALAQSSGQAIRVRMVEQYQGYTYLPTDGGPLLLAVPDDLVYFNGIFPTAEGMQPAAVLGDRLFKGSLSLQWVSLPKATEAVGYETFADCTALQGVVIGVKDRFLLSSGAFDGCSSLRFVASNAANIRLEDPDLELTVLGYSNSFLFAPTESQGYNRNWTSFNAAAGITGYRLVDCGGTQVLYATDESGTPWLALRAGSLAYGPVTLPTGTIEIFSCTFMDTKSRAEDAVLTLNWDQLTSLGWIDEMSFMNSDLGRDVTLPENLAIDYRAFKSCGQLENIVIPGTPDLGLYIGDEALYGCVNLHTVTFGDFRLSSAIQPSLFSGSGVRELIFIGYYIPELTNFGYGSPFYFEYDQEAAGELKITVPAGREEEYMLAWRYNLAGYPAAGEQTGFQVLWSEIDRDNPGLSYQEKMDKVDGIILEAENRMRVLLGMPEASQVTRPFTVVIDENDFITLVAARNIGSQTALSSDELDLPQNWALDFIASGAFRESPELRQVTVPETLAAIEHDAFAGLTFQEDDPYDVLYLYMADSSGIFGLNVRQEGTPFSFGVDDERVQVICSDVIMEDEDALATFIQFWTAPMAGYSDAEALENAVRAKLGPDASDEDVRAEMERILLPAENRVRQVLFCVEPTQELTFQFTLQGREAAGAGETEEVSPVEELSARKGKVADLAYIDRIDDKKEEELA